MYPYNALARVLFIKTHFDLSTSIRIVEPHLKEYVCMDMNVSMNILCKCIIYKYDNIAKSIIYS